MMRLPCLPVGCEKLNTKFNLLFSKEFKIPKTFIIYSPILQLGLFFISKDKKHKQLSNSFDSLISL
jgi:hypothetical protein